MGNRRAIPETSAERQERMRRTALLRYTTVSNPRGLDGHELIGRGLDFTGLEASDICQFPPGSPEKIEAMRARVSRCEVTTSTNDCDGYEDVELIINHAKPRHSKDGPTLCKREEYVYRDPSNLPSEPDIQADDF